MPTARGMTEDASGADACPKTTDVLNPGAMHSCHGVPCRCASLPVEERPVALRKGQQRSKEYLSMNPLGKVPCLKVSRLTARLTVAQELLLSSPADAQLFVKSVRKSAMSISHALAILQEADGFVLPESSAILKYLAQKHQVADHWYPSELSFQLWQVSKHSHALCLRP